MAPKSWLDIPTDSPFSLANIPFGIITTPESSSRHVGVAIGNYALDLSVFASNDGFSECSAVTSHLDVFSQPSLNDFAALGRAVHREVRHYLQKVFEEGSKFSPANGFTKAYDEGGLIPLKDVKTHLPFRISDYTDFFVGKHHAHNAGVIIRGVDNPLHPNYMHLPVAYHGRASSVVVSGTPIHRPHGQVGNPTAQNPKPVFTPSKRLDFELELGAFLCKANKMGEPVPIKEAEENFFGLVLMNDWSARDIQAWEMTPLGPFNSKNFGTSVSGWVVLMDALEPFKAQGIENENGVLPYMQQAKKESVYDLNLQVDLTSMAPPTRGFPIFANHKLQPNPAPQPQSPAQTAKTSSSPSLKCSHITQRVAVRCKWAICWDQERSVDLRPAPRPVVCWSSARMGRTRSSWTVEKRGSSWKTMIR